ncbi:hypothetical protein LAUMK142_00065 [Mycobacterium pseudokansasii]|uniref:Uncharacterized protein n=1 Tax=Mycobacterium pseudokansasii TaxID=2341080 RepID=A0A498QHX8_9MYCO|nr:hypothetical protein LAUMK142_00065 [Mycobacterium pseudokansasii]
MSIVAIASYRVEYVIRRRPIGPGTLAACNVTSRIWFGRVEQAGPARMSSGTSQSHARTSSGTLNSNADRNDLREPVIRYQCESCSENCDQWQK